MVQVPPAASFPEAQPRRKAAPAYDPGPLQVTVADPTRGEPDALVTLVQFGDLTDPFIGRAAPVLAAIERRFSHGELRIVWKNYPTSFHQNARPAALAAMAVFRLGGSAAFWSFHDAALAGWNDHSAARYQSWAAAARISADDFRVALAQPETARKVDADVELGDRIGAVSGTIFVNGAECSPRTRCTWIEGVDSRHVSTLVATEVNKALAALAGGAPRAGLSARLTRHNLSESRSAAETDGGAP